MVSGHVSGKIFIALIGRLFSRKGKPVERLGRKTIGPKPEIRYGSQLPKERSDP